MNLPNKLTLTRILLVPVFMIFVSLGQYITPSYNPRYYLIAGLIVVIVNYQNIPAMFAHIFESAFDFEAIFGGFAGSAMMYGIKRGLYSNEAGVGSAPNAAATAARRPPR